ncbi:metal ABC transporter permease [Lujinxingia vulgaris]|uniref:Metal ABC transporter permease n=1 Tax=Lujinxingia vulgaris TaxID=2600176 RepID=A0A5C6X4K8_9DELT|nr:metal ABC transporter permease [Lujinxingia vulgaris]TXD36686.1 metal ABC transporter permease [Lujinxingia vulgaris]
MFEFLALYGDLYRDPILTAMIAGLGLGLLGVYVVSRRIVFVSAALSQTSALGVTIAFYLSAQLGLAGLLAELLAPALAILLSTIVVFSLVWLGERPTLGRDALLGVAFIVPTALVLLLGPLIAHELHEVEAVLHGSAVLVRESDLYAILGATLLVVVTQLVAFRAFVFASLDPLVARTQGVPVRRLDAILFGAIALLTGLSTRALGALPTFGLTVLPAIGALGLNVGLKWVFIIAATSGAASGLLGYMLALATDWSVGASQTLVAALLALLLRALGMLLNRGARPTPSSAPPEKARPA